MTGLCQQVLNHIPMNVRQAEIATLIAKCQFRVLDSQQMQDRRIEVVDMNGITNDVVTIVVCFTVGRSLLDSRAGKKHGVASRVMITSIVGRGDPSLRINCATKLTSPDDEGILQQISLLEILNQCRSRLIGIFALTANGSR